MTRCPTGRCAHDRRHRTDGDETMSGRSLNGVIGRHGLCHQRRSRFLSVSQFDSTSSLRVLGPACRAVNVEDGTRLRRTSRGGFDRGESDEGRPIRVGPRIVRRTSPRSRRVRCEHPVRRSDRSPSCRSGPRSQRLTADARSL